MSAPTAHSSRTRVAQVGNAVEPAPKRVAAEQVGMAGDHCHSAYSTDRCHPAQSVAESQDPCVPDPATSRRVTKVSRRVTKESATDAPGPPSAADEQVNEVSECADAHPGAHPRLGQGPLGRLIRDQRIMFLIVGAMNTVIGTAYFVLFELAFGAGLGRFGYLVSLGCAHVASVLTAFVAQRYLVWRVRGHIWLDLFRFWLVSLTTLGLNAVSLPLLVELSGWPPILCQLLITAVIAIGTFFAHRDFSFRRRGANANPGAPQPKDH